MKRHLTRHNIFAILDVAKFGLLLILLLMFVNFNAKVANQTDETARIAENTNALVKSQKDVLNAIAQVTTDTKKTAKEQTSIIICMLQVPIANRSTDLQEQCRLQAANGVPLVSSGSASQTTQNSSDNSPVSSAQPTTDTQPAQPDNLQAAQNALQGEPMPNFLNRILNPVVQPLNSLINRLQGVQ